VDALQPSSLLSTDLDLLLFNRKFFDELAAVLERVATYQETIYVVCDFNIRLDRPDDVHADELRLLVDCFGLVLHDTGPTHQCGGTLDVVITHTTVGRPDGVRMSRSSTSGFQTTPCCAGRSMRLVTCHPL